MRVATKALLICTAALWYAPIASAEEPTANQASETPIEEAKRLFDEAIKEVDAGRANIGRDLLRRSLALYSTIATRYNLGVALRLTGETTEAIAMFDGLLREPALSVDDRRRTEAELKGARAELVTIVVRVTGADQATIELDGREVGTASADGPLVLSGDAGEHVVVARAGGVTRQQVVVEPGERAMVDLHVLSLAEQTAEERKQRRRKRAAWITGATAVAAAIVLAAVLTTRPGNQTTPPEDGDTPVTGVLVQARR